MFVILGERLMISKFLVLTIIPLILSIGLMPAMSFADSLKSPRQQMNDGAMAEDVICKGGFTLMIRMSGDAACVTPSTASKLSSAGWGEIIKEFEMQSEPEEEEVTLNEDISTEDEESSNDEESEEGETTEVNLNDGAGAGDSP